MRLPAGWQLVEPLAHCSSCNQPFSEACLRLWREDCNYATAFDQPVDDDFPEVCDECAEIEAIDYRLIRACGGSNCIEPGCERSC